MHDAGSTLRIGKEGNLGMAWKNEKKKIGA